MLAAAAAGNVDSVRMRVSGVAWQHAHRGDVGGNGSHQVQRDQRVVDAQVCRRHVGRPHRQLYCQ